MANGNGTCNCAAPSGPVGIQGGNYQVQAKAICPAPEAPTITYTIKTCEPQLFIDCRFTIWFKPSYDSDWRICRDGQTGWQATSLDTCPSQLFPLMIDTCTFDFWFIDAGCVAWRKTFGGEEWGAWSRACDALPRSLAHVFLNQDTGVPFFFPTCVSEREFRESVFGQPFCTTGYQ